MVRRVVERAKVTLSLPRELVQYADNRAMELGTNRSKVIGEALAERRAREEEDLAREGYTFFAEESEAFAAVSAKAVSEALGHAG